jgi:DNA modification methylase
LLRQCRGLLKEGMTELQWEVFAWGPVSPFCLPMPTLLLGNCLEKLAEMPDCSIDAIITDPPYGLSFMGKKWDYDVPGEDIWRECLRVLKPGGHLLAFAGTRTQHRMAVRIEDAGFEIRDMIAWVYGSGFPKSLDVSKAIDKASGAERKIISETKTNSGGMAHISKTNAEHGFRPAAYNGHSLDDSAKNCIQITAPATPEAQQWDGWGTALKPALEPITVARKPFKGTVAANVLAHGTGGLNVDECRVGTDESLGRPLSARPEASSVNAFNWSTRPNPQAGQFLDNTGGLGRWPANLIHDGSDEVVGLFPQTGISRGGNSQQINAGTGRYNWNTGTDKAVPDGVDPGYGDSGSAARFFYCAKTSKRERGEGNNHPTVKPIALMRYLCRLVTPPGGTVLDPFMGSGSTGIAARAESFNFVGIELDPDYFAIAQQRITNSESLTGDEND